MKYLFNRKIKTTLLLLLPILVFASSCSPVGRDVFSEDAHQRAIDAGIISHVEAREGDRVDRNLVEVGFADIVQVQENVIIEFDISQIRTLYFERDDVRLTDIIVSLNQEISKGDILALAEFDTREIEAEIEVLQLTIERHERAFERDLRQHQRTLREMMAVRDLIIDLNERQTQNLRIQRQELVLNNFTRQNERNLERYNERLEELSELLEGDKIIAPFDGIIVMARDGMEGLIFRYHDAVMRILDPARLQFVVTRDIGLIRLGDTFNVELRDFEFEALVVSDPIATDTREHYYTYVLRPTDMELFLYNMQQSGIEFSDLPTMRGSGSPIRHNISNVLAIPISAINEHDDDTYVLVYENGEIMTRFVETGFRDSNNIQILAGLVEGQVVVR